MMEDSNALVFMEGIKAVECLSILLGKSINKTKLKNFISLLVEKFKETKTAAIQAVNKCLSTIARIQALSPLQLLDYLISLVANKNPRVK